jgi:DNA-directed RNA polymerase I and III subunit RPAC1
MSNKIPIKENKHIDHLTNEFPAEDIEFFSLKNFKDNLSIDIKSLTEDEIVFDLKGVDAPVANALRRILISEIPTIAIETCNFFQNTSIIPDEVLAHRLGLVPIQVDANLFNYKNNDEEISEFNSLLFKLHAICPNNKESLDVLSGDLKWIPQGNQMSRCVDVKTVHSDILIAKLKPGQEIEVELICVKGIGKTHTKWSPVCTAFYRLLPEIQIIADIKGTKASELKQLCPVGVFDIEDSGKAFVSDSRKCTMCRECIRHDEFKNDIQLSKLKDTYECK